MKNLLRTIVLVGTITLASCASLLDVGMLHVQPHVRQRGTYDCAVAALALAAEKSYEAVYDRFLFFNIDPEINEGIWTSQIISVGKSLGVRFHYETEVDYIHDRGIIVIDWDKTDVDHVVYLNKQYIYDPLLPYFESYISYTENGGYRGGFKVVMFLKQE